MPNIELLNVDCMEYMKGLEGNAFDLTVTSPPYDNLRDYGDGFMWSEDIWKGIISELFRVTKYGGVVVWIVDDATHKGTKSGTSFKQALYAKDIGFFLHDVMIWEKSSSPFMSHNRYRNKFEYMFVFSKGAPKTHNLIRDRVNKHKKSTSRSERKKDGSTVKRKDVEFSELGYRFNIWRQNEVKNNRTNHPATYPLKLAEDHIKTWSNEGDRVLDIFLGSGTTAIAANNLNRDFVGCELDKDYHKAACERFDVSTRQEALF